MQMKFFKSPLEFREWLNLNHDKCSELWVGFHKKNSGKPSITWPESVDQALCFGWIDNVRKGIDETTYTIRFAPRKPSSIWSKVNIKCVSELKKLGLMRPPGITAFNKRKEEKSGIYSYENEIRKIDGAYEKKFKKNKKAWDYFQSRPPGYKKQASGWVMNAKLEETRIRRLETLIKDSENGLKLEYIRKYSKKSGKKRFL